MHDSVVHRAAAVQPREDLDPNLTVYQEKRVGELSGGQRNRVQLAKLLRRGADVIMLDEPTNDLDLATLRVLEDAFSDFAGTLMIVSHDRWFEGGEPARAEAEALREELTAGSVSRSRRFVPGTQWTNAAARRGG